MVIKQYPLGFHKNAEGAAKAALAAHRQGKFAEMEAILYKNMRALEEDKLPGYAKEIGLDMERFKKDFNSPAIAKELEQQKRDAAQNGVRGTPTFFINGKRLPREGRKLEGLKKLVEKELKKAS